MSKSKSLKDYHELIKQLAKDRGFDSETIPEKFMLLIEEVGEFAKAHRKLSGIKVDKNSKVHDLEEEAADCFWVLVDLCNNLGISLDKAFLAKENKNVNRTWTELTD